MLYYIHGYLSSPDGDKATLFTDQLQAKAIKYRDVPPEKLVIADCLTQIQKEISDDEQAILIGSSLGGFLAAKTAHLKSIAKLILINPAIIPPTVDISTIDDMPHRILKDMQDETLFLKKISSDITILVGTNDDLVPNDWSIEFAKAQQATIQFFRDDHRFSNHLHQLPSIIKHLI
jgi:predicted esterase YcpF (UPF0227 family)